MKKTIVLLFCFLFFVTCVPVPGFAEGTLQGQATQPEAAVLAAEPAETEPLTMAAAETGDGLTDSSSMTDEEFFGVWDSAGGKWSASMPGKLNYDGYPGLSEVERYVKEGNYADAKSEFLYYMKNRNFDLKGTNTSYNYEAADLLCDNVMWQNGLVLGGTFQVNGQEFTEYKIEVSDIVKRRGSFSFMLMQRYKAEDGAEIYTKEAGKELAPKLEVYYKGQSRQYSAVKDTYVAADDMDATHGSETLMYAKESIDPDENNPYRNLFGPETKRSYFQFNVTGLDKDTKIDSAFITIRARSLGEQTNLILWEEGGTLWKENGICWNNSAQQILSFNGSEADFGNIPQDTLGIDGAVGSLTARFQWATMMAGCYVTSRDERYAENLIRLLNSFIYSTRDNVGAYTSQDASMRVNLFVNIYHDLLRSESLDADSNAAFIKNFWQLAKFLTFPANYRPDHNHGCFQVRGLQKVTVYMPEFRDYSDWKDLFIYRWNELARNLMANNDYREGTTAYAGTVLNIFNNALLDADYYGFELGRDFEKYTLKLALYLAQVTFPNGVDIQLGDSDASDQYSIIKNTMEILEDDAIQYMITNGEDGVHPGCDSLYLEGSNKLAVMRSGWTQDDLVMVINAASADGRSHTHPDNLSLVAYAYGQRLLVDPGRNNYNDTEVSNWLRLSTESHNTITIDGKSQAIASGNVSLFQTNQFFDTYKGNDATVKPFDHQRNILFVKPYFWIVSDVVKGGTDAEHTYDQNWHFLPDANLKFDGDTLTTNFEEGANLKMVNVENPDVTGELRSGYYSPNAAGTEAAKYAVYTQNKKGEVAFDTILFPVKKGSTDDVQARRLEIGVEPSAASSFALDLTLNNRNYQSIVYTSHETAPAYRKVSTQYGFDGRQLYVEHNSDGSLSAINMSQASVVDCDGTSIVSFGDGGKIEDFSVIYDPSKLMIYSESLTPEKLSVLSLYADRSYSEVLVNDQKVSFYQNGDQIVFNENYDRIPVEASGSNMTGTIDGARVLSANFDYSGETMRAELQYPDQTVLTGEKSWTGMLPTPVSSAATVKVDGTVQACINFTNSSVTFDRPVTLRLPELPGKLVYVKNGKTYPLMSGDDLTVTERNGVLEIVFKNKLYEIIAYKKAPDGGGSSSRPSGGGGSPSGGGGSTGPSSGGNTNPDDRPPAEKVKFSDIAGHWAEKNILFMAEKGIVNGEDGNFYPDRPVTRAEFAAFLVRMSGEAENAEDAPFADVKVSDWFAGYVGTASSLGLIQGDGGMFRPDDIITREEAAVMLIRFMEYKEIPYRTDGTVMQYTDKSEISAWAEEAMYAVLAEGLMQGISESELAPKASASRAMAVTMLRRIYDKLEIEPAE